MHFCKSVFGAFFVGILLPRQSTNMKFYETVIFESHSTEMITYIVHYTVILPGIATDKKVIKIIKMRVGRTKELVTNYYTFVHTFLNCHFKWKYSNYLT